MLHSCSSGTLAEFFERYSALVAPLPLQLPSLVVFLLLGGPTAPLKSLTMAKAVSVSTELFVKALAPLPGVSKGGRASVNLLAACLSNCLEQAERKVLKTAAAGLHQHCQRSTGAAPVVGEFKKELSENKATMARRKAGPVHLWGSRESAQMGIK